MHSFSILEKKKKRQNKGASEVTRVAKFIDFRNWEFRLPPSKQIISVLAETCDGLHYKDCDRIYNHLSKHINRRSHKYWQIRCDPKAMRINKIKNRNERKTHTLASHHSLSIYGPLRSITTFAAGYYKYYIDIRNHNLKCQTSKPNQINCMTNLYFSQLTAETMQNVIYSD